jgi:tRNA A37 methylthiotransferase MiaB
VQRTETIAEELAKQFRLQFSGKTVEVLVEQMNPGGYWEGFSREYLRVQVKGNFEPNTLLQAVVVSSKVEPLTGEVI